MLNTSQRFFDYWPKAWREDDWLHDCQNKTPRALSTPRKLGISGKSKHPILTAGAESWGSICPALTALEHLAMLALAGSCSELNSYICLLRSSVRLLFSDCADPKVRRKTGKNSSSSAVKQKSATFLQSPKCWFSPDMVGQGCLQKLVNSYLIQATVICNAMKLSLFLRFLMQVPCVIPQASRYRNRGQPIRLNAYLIHLGAKIAWPLDDLRKMMNNVLHLPEGWFLLI